MSQVPDYTSNALQLLGRQSQAPQLLASAGRNLGQGIANYGKQQQAQEAAQQAAQQKEQDKQEAMILSKIMRSDDQTAYQLANQAYNTGLFDDEDMGLLFGGSGQEGPSALSVDRGAAADGLRSMGYESFLPDEYRGDLKNPTASKTVLYKDGTSVSIMNDGQTRYVKDAEGNILNGADAASAINAGVASGIQNAADVVTAKKGAEANVRLTTEPEIIGKVEGARNKAANQEKKNESLKTYEMVGKQLDRFDNLVDEGVYTGNFLDQAIKAGSQFGVVFDDKKLANTARVKQIATNLKFMAKPPGMGAMSDSEWSIITDAIPDPDSSTIEEIKAGIDEFRINLANQAGISPKDMNTQKTPKQKKTMQWGDLK